MKANLPNPIYLSEPIGAVITGDIIQSSKYTLDQRKIIRETIHQSIKELSKRERYHNAIPFPVHIYRGDSWQVLITEPVLVWRVAMYIRAALRAGLAGLKVNTRMSLSIARINQPGKSVSFGDGEAYILSGRGLDEITRKSKSQIIFSLGDDLFENKEFSSVIAAILPALDFISAKWTSPQAQAIQSALLGGTPEEIAANWPGGAINRRAISAHLNDSGWKPLEAAIIQMESMVGKERIINHEV